jgi:hypothetical protein
LSSFNSETCNTQTQLSSECAESIDHQSKSLFGIFQAAKADTIHKIAAETDNQPSLCSWQEPLYFVPQYGDARTRMERNCRMAFTARKAHIVAAKLQVPDKQQQHSQ